MKKMLLATLALFVALSASAKKNVYGFNVVDADGNNVSMKQFKGKVLLIVNTATRCGFTPQYNELEALYEKYRAEGFEILDFPCNQFGEQAPGTIAEIHEFCTANFNIQFPQFEKVDVNGPEASPLFSFLKAQRGFGGFNLNDRIGKLLDDNFRKKDPNYDQRPTSNGTSPSSSSTGRGAWCNASSPPLRRPIWRRPSGNCCSSTGVS